MPKKKFVVKKFKPEEEELSEEDRKSLQDFKSGDNLKVSSSSIKEDKIQRKPVQNKNKNQKKNKQSIPSKQVPNKENRQPQQLRYQSKTKQSQNPDDNLNRSILNSRKRKRQHPTGILKLPFQRLVKDITRKEYIKRANFQEGQEHYRYTRKAISLLQCNVEGYLIEVFQDSYLLTNHAKRVTLMNRDLFLARRIRGPQLIIFQKEIVSKIVSKFVFFYEINQTNIVQIFYRRIFYKRVLNIIEK